MTATAIPPKPRTYNGDLTRLPQALEYLRGEKIWVCWRWMWDGKKWTKPPLRADNPDRKASSSEPATWGTYEQALEQVRVGAADGIGFTLQGRGIGGVDLDACRNPKTRLIAPWATERLAQIPTGYCEATVSGAGLRILGTSTLANFARKFKLPDKGDGAALEMFSNSNHYLTLSCNEIGDCTALPPIEQAMISIADELGKRQQQDTGFDFGAASGEQPQATPEPEEQDQQAPWSFAAELRVRSALNAIPADEKILDERFAVEGGSRKVWLAIGMGLKHTGWGARAFTIFRDWSSQNPTEFDERNLRKQWNGFKNNRAKPVTIASLFWYARQFGWRVQQQPPKPDDYSAALAFVPYPWPDPAAIPPRGFVYSKDYIRKTCSAVIGAGGRTKSTLLLTEAVGMACGRNLLIGDTFIPVRVLLLNAEEPQEELDRRVAAIGRHYDVNPGDCSDRLCVRSVRNKSPRFGIRTERGAVLNQAALSTLEKIIQEQCLDVVLLEPWVSFHSVAENSNEEQDLVIKEGLGGIAERTDCAIGIGHHTGKPKPGQARYTAEDARGGSSFVWAVRNARILNFMTTAEASQLGIQEADRRRYIRVDTDKANMSPLGKVRWMQIVPELLPNGDEIACITEWTPKDPFESVSSADMDWCRTAADRCTYRWDLRSPDWIGFALAERLKLNVKYGQKNPREGLTRLKRILETWLKNNVFRLERRKDEQSRERLFVVPAITSDMNLDEDQECDQAA